MNDSHPGVIESVILNSYIDGIHCQQSKELALKGFHRDFDMIVLKDNHIEKVNIDKWLDRIQIMKKESSDLWQSATSCKFSLLDCTHNAAAVKVDVFKGLTHFSTDYMLLYKLEEGWRIVSKIYSVPE